MKKALLIAVAALALLGLIATPVLADGGRGGDHRGDDRGGHDRGGHDRDGRGRDGYGYHGWLFNFPPPQWIVGVPYCRDFTSQRYAGVDRYGQPVFVIENHVECLDAFGYWRIVQ